MRNCVSEWRRILGQGQVDFDQNLFDLVINTNNFIISTYYSVSLIYLKFNS